MAAKVIVSGSVNGRFPELFKRLGALHLKNNFNLGLVVGDLFASREASKASPEHDHSVSELLNGSIKVPLPTYFSLWQNPIPEPVRQRIKEAQGQICENLFFLDRFSITKTTEGFSIVNVGALPDGLLEDGVSAEEQEEAKKENHWSLQAAEKGLANHQDHPVSILLTSVWPTRIHKFTDSPIVRHGGIRGPPQIGEIMRDLRPRYHFIPSKTCYYEPPPFVWPVTPLVPVETMTRLISLAPFDKRSEFAPENPPADFFKSLYAFSIDPAVQPTKPRLLSPNPYLNYCFPRTSTSQETPKPIRFRAMPPQKRRASNEAGRPQNRSWAAADRECFFCLSSEDINTRLVASIGDDSYLTLAKGPLLSARAGFTGIPSTDASFKSPASSSRTRPLPAQHLQIIALAHVASLNSTRSPDADSLLSTSMEMDRYETALHQYVRSCFGPDFGVVTFELSQPRSIHHHRQCLVLPARLIRDGLVEAAYRVAAADRRFPDFQPDLPKPDSGIDHFRLKVWAPAVDVPEAEADAESELSGEAAPPAAAAAAATASTQARPEISKQLVLPLAEDRFVPPRWPREVLARLLEREDRADWRDCVQPEADEEAEAEAFRHAFRPFDFSLQEAEADNEGAAKEEGGDGPAVLAS